jgi:hypothetical protein
MKTATGEVLEALTSFNKFDELNGGDLGALRVRSSASDTRDPIGFSPQEQLKLGPEDPKGIGHEVRHEADQHTGRPVKR